VSEAWLYLVALPMIARCDQPAVSEGKLPIYEFSQTGIIALKETSFGSVNVHERRDLQRLLRENVEVIAPETLVISEEFGNGRILGVELICSAWIRMPILSSLN
jgi:hypothetical protein